MPPAFELASNCESPWEQLFPPPSAGGGARLREFRLVFKRGEPLLLLPPQGRAASRALSLYPAQSNAARLARSLLAITLRLGFTAGTKPARIFVDAQSPFARFISGPDPTSEAPCFAMLLGNPRVPGRRFVLLVFDDSGRPERIVKAGVGELATALIRREAAFLKTTPHDLLQAPVIIGEFTDGGIEAIALDYAAGPTPDARDLAPLARLLESWLDLRRTVRFAELPAARRLIGSAPDDPRLRRVLAELEGAHFHPVIFHGDFTPWNIRVRPADGRWTVLDWERGEISGPPAWDWFHFVIQHEILVRHAPTGRVLARAEALLHSAEFGRYAAAAGIGACARPLLRAYALYCCLVRRQAEGMARIEALLQGLQTR
jgi:hypothetical protein